MEFRIHNSIIGALHLVPLKGYEEFPGEEMMVDLAVKDLHAFQDGGVDAVIFENNYDVPHHEHISEDNYNLMLTAGRALVEVATIPLGVNVLWNDYRSALRLASELDLSFIRVPVFVDDVRTSYGDFHAAAGAVIEMRKKLGVSNTKIYADIHVKHSEIISSHTIEESARLAIDAGADRLIVTGKWTGDSPDLEDLKRVGREVGSFPVIVGSGADAENIAGLLRYADAAIVSTSLKEGVIDTSMTNLAAWQQRISQAKVQELMKAVAIHARSA